MLRTILLLRRRLDRLPLKILLCMLSAVTLFAQKGGVGWKDYLGGPDGSHYSPLKQINASNVSKMEVAWTYPAGR